MGFSDDDLDGVETGSGGCSASDDGNLNLLTILLDDRYLIKSHVSGVHQLLGTITT